MDKMKKASIATVILLFTATTMANWDSKIQTNAEEINSIKAGLVCTEDSKIALNVFFREKLEDQGEIYGEWYSYSDSGSLKFQAKNNMGNIEDILEDHSLITALNTNSRITFKAHSETKIYGTELNMKSFSKALRKMKRECK